MTTIELKGHITHSGEFEVELPPGLPEGDIKVVIELSDEDAFRQKVKKVLDEHRWLMDQLAK